MIALVGPILAKGSLDQLQVLKMTYYSTVADDGAAKQTFLATLDVQLQWGIRIRTLKVVCKPMQTVYLDLLESWSWRCEASICAVNARLSTRRLLLRGREVLRGTVAEGVLLPGLRCALGRRS